MSDLSGGGEIPVYPRTCEFCTNTYNHSSSFSRHRKLNCPKYKEFSNSKNKNEIRKVAHSLKYVTIVVP